jgi:hypothetical protein
MKKNTPFCTLLLLLFCGALQAQINTARLEKVDPYFLTAHVSAMCRNYYDTIYTVPVLPSMIQCVADGETYEYAGEMEYRIFYTPWNKEQSFANSWLYKTGSCRGFRLSFYCPQPGIYSLLFCHPEKPCLMQVAVTPLDLHQAEHYVYMRFYQRCLPDVMFRVYRPMSAHLNVDSAELTNIEVYWKPTCADGSFDTSDAGFSLVATLKTRNIARFSYEMPVSGIWRFRYLSPSNPYVHDEFLLCAPGKWQASSSISAK